MYSSGFAPKRQSLAGRKLAFSDLLLPSCDSSDVRQESFEFIFPVTKTKVLKPTLEEHSNPILPVHRNLPIDSRITLSSHPRNPDAFTRLPDRDTKEHVFSATWNNIGEIWRTENGASH